MAAEKFSIHFPQEQLDDLSRRLEQIRWPQQPADTGWERGTQRDELQALIEYWKNEFDWRRQEAELNRVAHYRCTINGTAIHFIHERGKGPSPLPLILTHGWPDSFLRYQKIIPLLTDPARFGGSPEDAFDVIIPSVPGFGLSAIPAGNGVNNAVVAEIWHQLMTRELGYNRFAAAGGDIGSGVTRYLAQQHPENVTGIHLTDIGILRELMAVDDESSLTEEERQYGQLARAWIGQEGGYMSLQATRPWTLAYALNDSPVGLASWIMEKFRNWSDCNGNLLSRFNYDQVLTNIMLYWLTGTAGSAANMYYDNAHSLPPIGQIHVPVGVACFPADILLPPRSWVSKKLNITRWSKLPRGGHFTAMEEPELYAEDVRAFFRSLRAR